MNRNLRKGWMAAMGISLFLAACGTGSAGPSAAPGMSPSPRGTPSGASFRVIGYATDAVTPGDIPYDKLTAINFAFLIPNPDGSFEPLANPGTGEIAPG